MDAAILDGLSSFQRAAESALANTGISLEDRELKAITVDGPGETAIKGRLSG